MKKGARPMPHATVRTWTDNHMDGIISAVESGEYMGFCTACGEEAYGIEPDAHEYKCPACDARAVYGAEELLLYC